MRDKPSDVIALWTRTRCFGIDAIIRPFKGWEYVRDLALDKAYDLSFQPDARPFLIECLRHPNPFVVAHAFRSLALMDPEGMDERLAALENDKREVETVYGCFGSPRPLGELARMICHNIYVMLELEKEDLPPGGSYVAQDRRGITPLHRAAECGDCAEAESLLREGADVNAQDKAGWTPLHWAAAMGRKKIAEFLITKGANLAVTDSARMTQLTLAIENKHDAVAQVLRKAGAKV